MLGQLTAGSPDFTTYNTGLDAGSMEYSSGTAIDFIHHRLFVNDQNNGRVEVYLLNSNNNLISHIPTYEIGQSNFGVYNTNPSQTEMVGPYIGIAYDSVNNRLFVSDASENRVMVFNLANGITDGMSATYVIGQSNWTNHGNGSGASGLDVPEGLAFDPDNDYLYVAEQANNRVLQFNVAPSNTSSNMAASHVLGQSSLSATNNPGSGKNGFGHPEALAYNDVTKQLFVGDSGNARVMVFDLANGITDNMDASYVLGQPDFFTQNTNVDQDTIGGSQEGLGIDTTRDILYEADDSINRVLVYDLGSNMRNGMPASMVLTQPNFSSNDYSCTTPSAYNMCDPEGDIAVDPVNNRIYVTDSGFNRILIFNFVRVTSTSLSDGTIGDSYNQQIQTTNSQGSLSYSVTSGQLPPGLSLNAATGVISGSPTTTGSYTFDVSVTDNVGAAGSFTDDPDVTISIVSNANSKSLAAPSTGYGSPLPIRLWETIGLYGLGLTSLTVIILGIRRLNRKYLSSTN